VPVPLLLLGLLAIFLIARHLPAHSGSNLTTVGLLSCFAILVGCRHQRLRRFPFDVPFASTAVYDYYFIPPTGTWNITDRGLGSPLRVRCHSVVGSTLRRMRAGKLDRRGCSAAKRKQLYDFSQRLLSRATRGALQSASVRIVWILSGSKRGPARCEDQTLVLFAWRFNISSTPRLPQIQPQQRDVRIDAEHGVSLIPLRWRTQCDWNHLASADRFSSAINTRIPGCSDTKFAHRTRCRARQQVARHRCPTALTRK